MHTTPSSLPRSSAHRLHFPARFIPARRTQDALGLNRAANQRRRTPRLARNGLSRRIVHPPPASTTVPFRLLPPAVACAMSLPPPPLSLLLPPAALVALTAVVWVRLYYDRVREMLRRRIRPQALARSVDGLQDGQAAANFRNLCEAPVLFYALCASAAAARVPLPSRLVPAAWAYVALRALHSAIHCTYNRVLHRFAVYAASTVLLFGMWAVFTAVLLQEAPS